MLVEEWREVAREMLPGFRNCVDEAETVRELWLRLYEEFEDPLAGPWSEADAAALFRYETWCLANSADEEAQSAVLWFYTELPRSERLRRELPKHMAVEDFLGSQEVFACQLTPEEYSRFRDEFLAEAFRRRARLAPPIDLWVESGAPN